MGVIFHLFGSTTLVGPHLGDSTTWPRFWSKLVADRTALKWTGAHPLGSDILSQLVLLPSLHESKGLPLKQAWLPGSCQHWNSPSSPTLSSSLPGQANVVFFTVGGKNFATASFKQGFNSSGKSYLDLLYLASKLRQVLPREKKIKNKALLPTLVSPSSWKWSVWQATRKQCNARSFPSHCKLQGKRPQGWKIKMDLSIPPSRFISIILHCTLGIRILVFS